MKASVSRNLFYAFLTLSFLVGVFFKQFDIWHPEPFVLTAFCGAIGLLWDYAWRIRHSLWALVPFLLSVEFLGDILYNAGQSNVAFWLYIPGALTCVAYGILFIRSGVRLVPAGDKGVAAKFILLGLMAISLLSWEIATYFPQDIENTHIGFRVLFLAVFAWLLFIDFTTDFSKRPELKIERQILRTSLLLITMWYFVRFVFK